MIQDNAGFSLRDLANRTGLSIATLSNAMKGEKLPTWKVVESIVVACGGNVDDWNDRWSRAKQDSIINTRPKLRGALSAREILLAVAGPPPVPQGDVNTVGDFMMWLRKVRLWAGNPTIRQIAAEAGVAPTTMYDFLANKNGKLPSMEKVFDFLKGCGVSSGAVFAEWRFHWIRLAQQLADQAGVGQSPVQPVADHAGLKTAG